MTYLQPALRITWRHHAYEEDHLDDVRRLLDQGIVDVNHEDFDRTTALWMACRSGHVSVATLILDRGADVDRPSRGRMTALMAASEHGHVDATRLLLNRGAEVDLAPLDGAACGLLAGPRGDGDAAPRRRRSC
mmetsp:Transcript_23456/g.72446  ORF Transcript_23456/g.72446 Transcript_23456/m.72446 type:complete len:133 (-) Transcript_23456:54-452(-)